MCNKVCMSLFKFEDLGAKRHKLIKVIENLIKYKNLEYIFFDSILDLDPLYYQLITDLKNKYPIIKRIIVIENEEIPINIPCTIQPSKDSKYDGVSYLNFSYDYKDDDILFTQCDLIGNSNYCIFCGKSYTSSASYKYATQRNKKIIVV